MKKSKAAKIKTLALAAAIVLTGVVCLKAFNVVTLTGSVYDLVNDEPVTVRLIMEDGEGRKRGARSNSAEKGAYLFTGLQSGETYEIYINNPNYLKEKFTVTIPETDKYAEISRDLTVKPLQKGALIPLPVDPFELNKTKMRFGADMILEDLATTMKINPEVSFKISCYPDKADDMQSNLKLTNARCDSLKKFFVKEGVDASRLTTQGHGEIDPMNPLPVERRAKGKRYKGPAYIEIIDF